MTTRYQNRWTVTGGVVCQLIALSFYARQLTSDIPTVPGRFLAGTCFALWCWVMASATLFPSVRLYRDELVVNNLLFTYRIPWKRVVDVQPDGGMEIVTRGGGEIGSFAFSASLLGELTGNRTSRRAAAAIMQYRKGQADKTREGDVTREIPVLRHVVWLACSWVIFTGPLLAISSP